MKTRNLLFALLTLCVCASACTAKTVRETRPAGSFQKIRAGGGIDVYFTQGNSQRIEVEADEDIIQKIRTEVEGETLVIERKNGISFSLKGTSVKVYVTAPVLIEAAISGGADFYAKDLVCDKPFNLKVSGGADAHIDNLSVSGNTDISASGGGDCNIKSLQTGSAGFSASGGSDINAQLNASGNISLSATGGSDIKLSGRADKVTASASGGSDIDVRQLNYNHIDAHQSGGSDVYKN